MAHAHGHGEHEGRAFGLGLGLNAGYVVVEAVLGLFFGSLALLADAGHNLVDVVGLLVAWIALRLGRGPSTPRNTYGWRKVTVLAPLINAMLILLAAGAIALEALQRLRHPPAIPGLPVLIVALVGFVINTGTALLFARDRKQDLNRRGVFWHMASDAVVSLAVVLVGAGILATGWLWLDPVVSLVVVTVVVAGTWHLVREAFGMMMDAVPLGIDTGQVGSLLNELPGVTDIHDLHIWSMSTTENALTAHLVIANGRDHDAVIRAAVQALRQHFPIHHVTLQAEQTICPDHCPIPDKDNV